MIDSWDKTANDPVDQWADILSAPARFIHARRIVDCYDDSISLDVAKQLQGSDRVQIALKLLIMDRFALPELARPTNLDESDWKLAVMPPEQIPQFSRLAGAVFWGHIFAAEIRNSEVAEMKSRLGDLTFQTALTNRDLASNAQKPESLDALELVIERDGYRCLTSWQAVLPAGFAAWVRLRQLHDSPASLPADKRERQTGVAIARRLAATLEGKPTFTRSGA